MRCAPVALHDVGSSRDLLCRGLGHPEDVGEGAPLGGGGGLPCERQERSALSFAQVVAGWLARDCRVSEDPEIIIAQLESQAPRGQNRLENIEQVGDVTERRRSADCAEEGRVDNRVVGRLVQCHLERVAHVQRIRMLRIKRGLLGCDVEVLAQRDLRMHIREPACKRTRAVLSQCQGLLVRGCRRSRKEEIADQNSAVPTEVRRRSDPRLRGVVIRERSVRGGHAASFVGLVDDVVVDEGTGLIELQCRAEMGQ